MCQLQIKLGAVNVKEGTGTANTSLVYHAGRLLALHEGRDEAYTRQEILS